jgi:RNA methyltransferase, TrmH family
VKPPAETPITSAANSVIKFIRSLQRRKGRDTERAFVLEGHRALADALDAGITPTLVLIDEGLPFDQVPSLPSSISVRWATSQLFKDVSETQHPQGILAVVPFPVIAPTRMDRPLTLVVDGVRDPGNLGTLLRSAAGAGVDRVALLPTTVDPYNAKVVRAGMGAHFRVAINAVDEDALGGLVQERALVALLDADGDVNYDDVDWTKSAAIVVGGEAFGPTTLGASVATVSVRVPLAGGVESLNAGIAGSVVLFEAARQRRARGGTD